LPFTSGELLRHAEVDPPLKATLEDATIRSGGELGSWLRDQVGVRDAVVIKRLSGRRWRVTHTSDTLRAR
jgi:hypothetical protein